LTGAEPWAALDRIYVAASNFFVTGYVTFCPERPSFRVSPGEVAKLIEAPLQALQRTEAFAVGERDALGEIVLEGYFSYQGHRIWGATAVLLEQLLERLRVGFLVLDEEGGS
jgi:hypothetical protein